MPVAVTDGDAGRRIKLEKLLLRAIPDIRRAAYLESGLWAADVDALVASVNHLIDGYEGPSDNLEAFTEWSIATVIKPGAERLRSFADLRRDNRMVVLDGIWSVLRSCADLGIHYGGEDTSDGLGCLGTAEELEAITWFRVFVNLDSWLTPGYSKTPGRGPAKISTRLRKFARSQALGWRTERLRARRRHITREAAIQREENSEQGKLQPRPIVLGPGDQDAFDGDSPSRHRDEAYDIPLDDDFRSDGVESESC